MNDELNLIFSEKKNPLSDLLQSSPWRKKLSDLLQSSLWRGLVEENGGGEIFHRLEMLSPQLKIGCHSIPCLAGFYCIFILQSLSKLYFHSYCVS